ncbi:hypothetical protein [Clostridium sp. CF012]|uniref:hypothetical protein n=1 Tax=Clostridium sp. CF012 TaxID=2843319 RepID=UPI001C0AD8D7|nr:hypothetical protein [Clostridium sp. CF012]MBU3146835.1 hypothetical protein [Clostridium sp. CF012]
MQDILSILYPVLLTILMGFLGLLGKAVVKLVPKLIDFIVLKISLANYMKGKLVALDIWNVIEEHFRLSNIIGDTVQAKVVMFETLIKQKIPGITDMQIANFRQAIAGEFNKNKPLFIKAIEDTITVATPIIKYFAPDGITELQPVVTITPTTTI